MHFKGGASAFQDRASGEEVEPGTARQRSTRFSRSLSERIPCTREAASEDLYAPAFGISAWIATPNIMLDAATGGVDERYIQQLISEHVQRLRKSQAEYETLLKILYSTPRFQRLTNQSI